MFTRQVLRKMDRIDEAIKAYTTELSYEPSSIKALSNRAFCYSKKGDYKKAIFDYDSVVKMDKTNLHALHNKGISLQRLNKFEEVDLIDKAAECFSHIIDLNQEAVGAYFNRGCCYDSLGWSDKAILDYNAAMELESMN